MLVVGDVRRTVGQDHDGRIASPVRNGGLQDAAQQLARDRIDGARDRTSGRQVRRQRGPGGQGVGESGGGAEVVLEHQEPARRLAHDIEADDRGRWRAGREPSGEIGLEAFGLVNRLLRDDARFDDSPSAVGVDQEVVQRPGALPQSGRQRLPLGGSDQARHRIDDERVAAEGDVALGEVAVDPRRQLGEVDALERAEQVLVTGTRCSVFALLAERLTIRCHGARATARAAPAATALIPRAW